LVEPFAAFEKAFPPEGGRGLRVNADELRSFVKQELRVSVPAELYDFWVIMGSGYFGRRDLYFFGDGHRVQARDSFQEWNTKDFWADVYPPPSEGGPVFFAETCFGDQLGFRWESSRVNFVLFTVDTFDAFVVAQDGQDLFARVLCDRFALVDKERLEMVSAQLGELQTGMHYAPIVSPMLGGDSSPGNFSFETPNVHFRTAVQTYRGIQNSLGAKRR
jgi:hypothetical protein